MSGSEGADSADEEVVELEDGRVDAEAEGSDLADGEDWAGTDNAKVDIDKKNAGFKRSIETMSDLPLGS